MTLESIKNGLINDRKDVICDNFLHKQGYRFRIHYVLNGDDIVTHRKNFSDTENKVNELMSVGYSPQIKIIDGY